MIEKSQEHGNMVPRASLNVACLSIFWQPSQPLAPDAAESKVAAALIAGEDPEWLPNYFIRLLESEQPGAAFSASAITHEWRHFDDILLTHWGNYLFAHHFFAVVQNLKLWRRIQQSEIRHIRVPIQPTDFPDLEELVYTASQANAERSQVARHGRFCAEMLAYWIQHQWVWATRETEEQALKYLEEARRSIEEVQLFQGLNTFGLQWGAPREEFVDLVYRLLLGCLAHTEPDAFFANIINVVQPSKMSWTLAREVLERTVLPSMEFASAAGMEVFRHWFSDNIERIILTNDSSGYLTEDDKEMLLNIAQEFLDLRQRLRIAIDNKQPVYREFGEYWQSLINRTESDRPGPRLYAHYPFNEGFVYWGKPIILSHDFFHVHTVDIPSKRLLKRLGAERDLNRPVSTVLIHPLPNMNFGVNSVLSDKWATFAREFVGCVMITDGCSPRDPTHGHWRSVIARNAGVEIKVRYSNYDC